MPAYRDVRRSVVTLVVALGVGLAAALIAVAMPAQGDGPTPFTTVGTATVTGQPYVGDCLTANVGNWDPTPDSFGYQWLRGTTPIDGATSYQYTPTSDDVGSQLSVTVTGSKSGYADTPTTSAQSNAIAQPSQFTSSPQPTIDGASSPTVGTPLTVETGSWTPGNVTFSYQWMSGGSVVQSGSSTTYTPASTDVGNAITVAATGSEPAYATTTETSQPTATVARGQLATDTPTISGTTTVGSTLTATPGANWGPGTVSFDYAWSSNGTLVQDSSSSTYTLVGSDAGNTISVKVTGSKPGYSSSAVTSSPTATIANGTLTSSVPTITGSATVGSTLTANPGSWGPGNVSFTYTWWSNASSNPLQSNSSATYVPAAGDIGNTITVTVTGSETGYDPAYQTSAATSAVIAGTLSAGTPMFTGTASVGSPLTVNPGTWGPSPVTLSYVWSSGGTVLANVTGTTYTPQPSDAGNTITVTVTGSETGYTASSQTATSTTVGLGSLSPTPTPTITGTAVVGSALTANAGTWGPGTVSLDYRWMSGSNVLQDGPGPTYTPSPTDVGNTITVTVTGTETGYVTTSETSSPTSAVVKGTLSVSPTPSITGTPTFTQTLTANAPASAWGPGTVTLAYQWLLNGAAISGQTGSTYNPVATDVGGAISLQVTGSESGYTNRTSTSAALTIAPATFSATPIPTITGPSSVLHRLSAVTSGWSPSPDSFTYTWYRNGTQEPGASDDPSKYQLAPADFGDNITLVVTGVKAGYTSVTPAASAPNGPIQQFQATFQTSPTPTVTGANEVGTVLTANPGTWSPTPDSFTYVWQRGSGDPNGTGYTTIQNATSYTYTLTPADYDQSVIVRVTAVKAQYTSKTEPSDESDPVDAGSLTPATPTISGSAQVGGTLTASAGNWSPTTGITFDYQWMSGSTVLQDGASSTYSPVAGDVGNPIYVAVTGTATGYDPNTQQSTATAAVAQGQFSTVTTPTITGTAAPGKTLTANVAAWTPNTGFSYQWSVDGTPVTGQTASTFVVPGADAGHSVTVTVKSVLPGYRVTPSTSAGLTITALTFDTPPKPTISGTAKVGSTLTAKPGTWSPVAPTFTYRWSVTGGGTQPTDTDSTYVPTAADAGHEVSVTVTGSAAGYTPRTSSASSATSKVATGTLKTATPTVSDTTPTVNVPITASTGTWSTGTTFTYQWYRGSTSISGAKSASYTPTGSDYGNTLKVKVTGSLSGYTSASKTSAATKDVGRGTLQTSAPTITVNPAGEPTVGSVLAAVANWGPSSVTKTYQWYRKSSTASTFSAISGATKSTYTIGSTSVGYTIEVKVTGTKTGYTTKTLTSAPTDAVS